LEKKKDRHLSNLDTSTFASEQISSLYIYVDRCESRGANTHAQHTPLSKGSLADTIQENSHRKSQQRKEGHYIGRRHTTPETEFGCIQRERKRDAHPMRMVGIRKKKSLSRVEVKREGRLTKTNMKENT